MLIARRRAPNEPIRTWLRLQWRRWRQLLANRGVRATGRTAASSLRSAVLRRVPGRGAAQSPMPSELWRSAGLLPMAAHPFDQRYGTETSGLIWGEDLPTGQASDPWNTAYYGIAPSIFRQAMSRLCGQLESDMARCTLVDLGSGKGRAVLLASLLPFVRVVGVELVPRLHTIALANAARFRSLAEGLGEAVCPAIDLVLADAAAFPWTQQLQIQGAAALDGPLVIFLYHPFARPVLRALLRSLRRELDEGRLREVFFLYVNPELDAELTGQTWITRLCQETVAIGPEDRLADRFGSTEETFAIYRCTPQRP